MLDLIRTYPLISAMLICGALLAVLAFVLVQVARYSQVIESDTLDGYEEYLKDYNQN